MTTHIYDDLLTTPEQYFGPISYCTYEGPPTKLVVEAVSQEPNTTIIEFQTNDQLYFGNEWWIFVDRLGNWYKPKLADWEKVHNSSLKQESNTNQFANKIDAALEDSKNIDILQEGAIININTVISNAIKIPEGDYIIAVLNADHCTLIPTSETNREKFEVFKPTLTGFFNPEIHLKTIEGSDGETISESS